LSERGQKNTINAATHQENHFSAERAKEYNTCHLQHPQPSPVFLLVCQLVKAVPPWQESKIQDHQPAIQSSVVSRCQPGFFEAPNSGQGQALPAWSFIDFLQLADVSRCTLIVI